ncbi:MAG: 4Fe-4S binding protein [Thermoplasmatota archaeon]
MKLQQKRLLSQIIFIISANLGYEGFPGLKTGLCFPFFYCHACPSASAACPLRSLEQSVFKESFAWRLFLYPLLIIGFVGILTGRAVCAWACPIGLLQRATSPLARKVKKKPLANKIGNHKIEGYLRYTKYILLISFVFISSYLIGFMFTDICPIGFLTGTIPTLLLYPGRYIGNFYFTMAFIILLLFFVLILLIERGWCRYFCPVGALLAPFNKISFLHIDVNRERCKHCNLCSYKCPMGINVPEMKRDLECILCGKCVTACPENIISFKRGG